MSNQPPPEAAMSESEQTNDARIMRLWWGCGTVAEFAERVASIEKERIAKAIDYEASVTPCHEDAVVVRDVAALVRADFSYEMVEQSANEIERLRAEITDLRTSVAAFAGPWAARYAKDRGLPDGHLHPTHYDILARAGARMDDFTRGEAIGDGE